jgi:phage shock protein PspC (stress-responsive transcriptional regulator)
MKRSRKRIIGGVCAGLAKATNTSVLAWRLIFLLAPHSLLIYIIMWILFKKEDVE